jgi:hypothetical protein
MESAVLHELIDQHALVVVLAEAEEADEVLVVKTRQSFELVEEHVVFVFLERQHLEELEVLELLLVVSVHGHHLVPADTDSVQERALVVCRTHCWV